MQMQVINACVNGDLTMKKRNFDLTKIWNLLTHRKCLRKRNSCMKI